MLALRPSFHHLLATICIAALSLPAAAQEDDTSAWSESGAASARLLAGGALASDKATLRAGLEIALKPGWKTYWRYPGDAGMPPRIAFARSDNVKAVKVLWPAPTRFDDGAGGLSIGYRENVLLPLHVTRNDADKPAVLRLDVDYAICEKLCVPVEARLELPLQPQAATVPSEALRAAELRVPRRSRVGAHGPLAVTGVTYVGAPKPHVVVDVAAPPGAAVDLLAEGPNAEWALPLPQPVAGAPAGTHRFRFDLDGVPRGSSAAGAALTLTAVSKDHAVEVEARLD